MECKRNKWNCEEGGGGGRFQRSKVRVAWLDGDELEKEMERYHGVDYMASLPVFRRWKELAKVWPSC